MRLVAADVTIRYGDRTVVEGFSHDFAQGVVTCLVGPSGVGKSSLLSVLGGTQVPTAGTVDVVDEHGQRHELDAAWISQKPVVFAGRATRDNVAVGARARGIAGDGLAQSVDQALADVGLDQVADHPAGTLSGGELQRLTVARADLYGAPFLFADEPTGSLDAATSRLIGRLLVSTAVTGNRCVIIATHDRALAAACDETIELAGR